MRINTQEIAVFGIDAFDNPYSPFTSSDIHIHVPAGAVPKDGPSAGITIATALASLLVGRPVRDDIGMTGEITLRGQVLPVGGIKEKVLAAHRIGLRTVILPRRNEKDLDDLPPHVRQEMTIILVDRVDDVLNIALRDGHDTRQGEDKEAVPLSAEDITERTDQIGNADV